jgi:hypothetical protein
MVDELERILYVLLWIFGAAAFAGIVWVVYNLDIFPRKRLRNIPFSEVKIGQVFFDYGGEELKLREYIKTGELEAKCLSFPDLPLTEFDMKEMVKIEVISI